MTDTSSDFTLPRPVETISLRQLEEAMTSEQIAELNARLDGLQKNITQLKVRKALRSWFNFGWWKHVVGL